MALLEVVQERFHCPYSPQQYLAGGALAPSMCIYVAPDSADQVLCVDAEGSVELCVPDMPGLHNYIAGGVLAPSGCIYCAPFNNVQVLCINT